MSIFSNILLFFPPDLIFACSGICLGLQNTISSFLIDNEKHHWQNLSTMNDKFSSFSPVDNLVGLPITEGMHLDFIADNKFSDNQQRTSDRAKKDIDKDFQSFQSFKASRR